MKESKTLAKQIAMTNIGKKWEITENLVFERKLAMRWNLKGIDYTLLAMFQVAWEIWFGVKNQTNHEFYKCYCILLSVKHKHIGNPFAEVYLRNNPSNQTDIKKGNTYKVTTTCPLTPKYTLVFICAPVCKRVRTVHVT